jgi:hypothetical protein
VKVILQGVLLMISQRGASRYVFLPKYFSNNHAKDVGIGGVGGTHWEEEKCLRGNPNCRWRENIVVDLYK